MEQSVTVFRNAFARRTWSLDKATYEIVRNSILKNLFVYGAMTFEQLGSLVEDHLKHKFGGSLWQYYAAVEQELEARGEIRRIPETHLQKIALAL
jgi:hypothetical protein